MDKKTKRKLDKDIQYGKDMQSYWNAYRKDFLFLLVIIIILLIVWFFVFR